MNMWMKLLQQRDSELQLVNQFLIQQQRLQKGEKKYLKCHFSPSFFYNKLYSDKKVYDYQAVTRWTKPDRLHASFQTANSILDCDLVFFPIHLPGHWVLVVADLRPHVRSLTAYDSIQRPYGQETFTNVFDNIARYLKDEALARKQVGTQFSDWRYEIFPKEIPQQGNGYDCGVFIAFFADYLSRSHDLSFTQNDLTHFRRRMAVGLARMKIH